MSANPIIQPDGILFDLDGVIADVCESYRECILRTAADFGCTVSPADIDEAKRLGDATNDWILTQRLLAARGVVSDLDSVTEQFQSHYLGTEDNPGLRDKETLLVDRRILVDLTDQYPSAIVTGRPRKEAIHFLECLGIAGCFRMLVCMEDVPAKPAPDGIRLAMAELAVKRPCMIGDTPDDIVAASAAGIPAVGIAGTAENQTALLAAGAAFVLPDLNDFSRYLN